MTASRALRRLAPVACLVAALAAVGCSSSGSGDGVYADSTTGQRSSGRGYQGPALEAMTTEYAAGRYSAAYRAARDAAAIAEGADKQRAMLIAGLSAQALGQNGDAKMWFREVERSSDPEIAGRARAGLGLIALNEGDHVRAAALLSTASAQLSGDEAARSSFFAGQAYEAMGRLDRARTQYLIAKGLSDSPSLSSNVQSALASLGRKGYTVQLGAFASRVNAQRAADSYSDETARLNLGSPRIVERRGVGASGEGVLYLVQVGSFRAESEAESARNDLMTVIAENRASRGAPMATRPFVATAFAAVSE
ncbi:MAG: SPOR domain-containing protein [Phycisphaerales bacterium]